VFLRNSWYVAAWDREVSRAPLARMLLGEPVVLYRKADGTPIALEDRCCHRHLPLSRGRVEGDGLRCGYHGLRFDASGKG
jgi:phenylpropionate dioxygenase-like ring-hydroxylating dioxygenase large terminal subunit